MADSCFGSTCSIANLGILVKEFFAGLKFVEVSFKGKRCICLAQFAHRLLHDQVTHFKILVLHFTTSEFNCYSDLTTLV